jgi:hypothetical protein
LGRVRGGALRHDPENELNEPRHFRSDVAFAMQTARYVSPKAALAVVLSDVRSEFALPLIAEDLEIIRSPVARPGIFLLAARVRINCYPKRNNSQASPTWHASRYEL